MKCEKQFCTLIINEIKALFQKSLKLYKMRKSWKKVLKVYHLLNGILSEETAKYGEKNLI
jgi:hypothetical protein